MVTWWAVAPGPRQPTQRSGREQWFSWSDHGRDGGVHVCSFPSIVMFAFSRREIGHPALAAFAIATTLSLSAPGILAATSRWDCVTVKPASVFSSVIVAVVWMDSGVMPALPSSAENAIEKQPAWAAAMSSSGLVPTPFSKRVLKEYG